MMTFPRIVTGLLLLSIISFCLSCPLVVSFATAATAAGSDSFDSLVSVGKPAPDFALTDTNGKAHKLSDYKGKFVVLEWFNHTCPFVGKHYDSGNMQRLQKAYTAKGVVWLSICSSAKGKPGNMLPAQHNAIFKQKGAAPTAILIDEDGKVGRLFGAKTTPAMYVINSKGVLVYAGAIDDKPGFEIEEVREADNYVKDALDQSMAGKNVTVSRTNSYGCSIKY